MSTLNLGDSLIMNSDIVVGTETKTGATFDGKPVYCMAYYKDSISISAGANSAKIGDLPSSIENIILQGGTMRHNSATGNGLSIPYCLAAASGTTVVINTSIFMWANFVNGTLMFDIQSGGSTSVHNIRAFIYYTKTTD